MGGRMASLHRFSQSTRSNLTPAALLAAAGRGNTGAVQQCLDAGVDVNCTDPTWGGTPLHTAVCKGNPQMVGQLLRGGAAVNTADIHGTSPLITAGFKGSLEMVGQLLGAGAAVNAVNKEGWTPLHVAAQEGRVHVVAVLLAAGADVNAANKDGKVPLHNAAWHGRLEVVQQLLGAGAAKDAADKDGQTALHMAAKAGRLEVTRLLGRSGVVVNTEDTQQGASTSSPCGTMRGRPPTNRPLAAQLPSASCLASSAPSQPLPPSTRNPFLTSSPTPRISGASTPSAPPLPHAAANPFNPSLLPPITFPEVAEGRSSEEAILCKICMELPVDTRLNCGHMLCSSRCAPSLSECPFCRAAVTERQRVFF